MKLSDKYTVQEVAGEQILLPSDQTIVEPDSIIKLNGTAGFIINLLKADTSEEQLLNAMSENYRPADNSELEQLKQDLNSFLTELRQKGMLND